jgi:hypothetical protein
MAVKGWRHRAPGAIIRENHHTETRTELVPQSVLDRLAVLEKREMEWQKAMQLILQFMEDHKVRVEGIEIAMGALNSAAEQQLKKVG